MENKLTNKELEDIVIGTLLTEDQFDHVNDLSSKYFFNTTNKKIVDLIVNDNIRDIALIASRLNMKASVLSRYYTSVAEQGFGNFRGRYGELKDMYLKRELSAVKNIELGAGVAEIVGKVSDVVMRVNNERFVAIEYKKSYADCGFETINNICKGGFKQGRFWVVGARSGSGKTTFVCNLAYTFLKHGGRVLFVETEIEAEEIYSKVRACGDYNKDKFELIETTEFSVMYFKILNMIESGNTPDLVVIDGIGDLEHGAEMDEHKRVDKSAVKLHELAKNYGLRIVTTSQLNRAMANSKTDDQTFAFRSSAYIEGKCGLGMILRRDEENNSTELIIQKNTYTGTCKTIDLLFYNGVFSEKVVQGKLY